MNKRGNRFIDRTGEEVLDKYGEKFTIIEYNHWGDVTIQFENGFISKKVQYSQIKKKNVTNPYRKTVYGVGYLGEGEYKVSVDRKLTKEYTTWFNMLTRVYNEDCLQKNTTYREIVICEDWHCFQNFAEWHKKNWKPWMDSSWHLDKDVICKECKIYSPETCAFIPQEINKLFSQRKTNFIMGISYKNNNFIVQININKKSQCLGRYKELVDAKNTLKQVKEKYLKEVASKWKDLIEPRVYDAICNYEIKIEE